MATATLTGTPTPIDMAEAVTNWGGDSFSLEPDIKVQSGNSVACSLTTNGNNDVYVTGSWDFSGGGLGDQHLRLWFNISFIGNLSATNPIQVFLYDGTNTAYYNWTKSSSYSGGWVQAIIDTSATPDSGSVNKAAITRIGIRFVTSTKPRNVPANAWFDAWYYGDGYTVTGGTNGDPIDWGHIASVDATNAYGIVTELDGVFFLKGAVQIGDGTSTTYFEPASQICQYTDEQVNAALYSLSFVDSVSALTNINISGGAWSAAGTQRYLIDATDADINAFTMDGVQVSRAADASGFLASASITNCSFNDCLQIDPSTSTFENNTIANSTATDGALLWPGGTSVNNCAFLNNNRGIEVTQAANQTFDALTFSGNTNDVHLNNGGTSIDIAKNNGANPATYVATGGGTVTYTGSSRTVTITALDTAGDPVESCRAFLRTGAAGLLPFDATVTISNSGTTATVTHTAHGMVTGDKVVIYGADFTDNLGVHTITVTGANTYTFTTAGTNSGADAGATIKCYYCYIDGLTNASGQISYSRVFPADQVVTGAVRKSSGAPYYKAAPVSGTVSSTENTPLTATMLSDD